MPLLPALALLLLAGLLACAGVYLYHAPSPPGAGFVLTPLPSTPLAAAPGVAPPTPSAPAPPTPSAAAAAATASATPACPPPPPHSLAFIIAANADASLPRSAGYFMLALSLRRITALYPAARVVVVNNGARHSAGAEALRALLARHGEHLAPTLLHNSNASLSGYELGAYGAGLAGAGWGDPSACLPFATAVFMQETMALINPLPPSAHAACFQPLFHFSPGLYDSEAQRAWAEAGVSALPPGATPAAPPAPCPGTFATSFLLSRPCLTAWLAARVFQAIAVPDKDASKGTERMMAGVAARLCGAECGCGRGEGGSLGVDGDYTVTTGPGRNGDVLEDFVRDPSTAAARHVLKSYGTIGGPQNADLGEALWEAMEAAFPV